MSSFVDLQLRTEATSAEYDVSDERKAELTAALEGIGSSNVEIGYEVTFPLVAENGPEALRRSFGAVRSQLADGDRRCRQKRFENGTPSQPSSPQGSCLS